MVRLDVFLDFFEVVWSDWMLVLIGYCQNKAFVDIDDLDVI